MSWQIIEGDAFDLLPTIEAGSVDCCITGPPRFQLRSYLPEDDPRKPLELGGEETVDEYVAKLVRACGLVWTCLAEHGTLFLNIGDSYLDGNACLVPQRLVVALRNAGWIVRGEIIWHKTSAVPISIPGWAWDRCRLQLSGGDRGREKYRVSTFPDRPQQDHNGKDFKSSAQWTECAGCPECMPHEGRVLMKGPWRPTPAHESIFLLAKSERYFADGVPVQTASPHSASGVANARDVQAWASEPEYDDFYAAYPSELVQWCLRAATSAKGYCPRCGMPWCRVLDRSEHPIVKTSGWLPSCSCRDADTLEPRPPLVLDPFCGGSGRTGIACQRLGANFLGIELNPTYVRMASGKLYAEFPLFA